MPMYVAGYYVPFRTVRVIMKGIQIPDRGVDDNYLEFPINNWLAENNHLNVCAGGIAHPIRAKSRQEDGVLLMTRFFEVDKDDPIVKDVKEDERRDIQVKAWLAKEGGVPLEDFEWIGLWDNFSLTRSGITPRRNDVQGPQRPRRFLEVSKEDLNGWCDSDENISLSQYILRKEKLEAAKSEQPSK